jgi:hypothetical protein
VFPRATAIATAYSYAECTVANSKPQRCYLRKRSSTILAPEKSQTTGISCFSEKYVPDYRHLGFLTKVDEINLCKKKLHRGPNAYSEHSRLSPSQKLGVAPVADTCAYIRILHMAHRREDGFRKCTESATSILRSMPLAGKILKATRL